MSARARRTQFLTDAFLILGNLALWGGGIVFWFQEATK